jgi:hypothetical protein
MDFDAYFQTINIIDYSFFFEKYTRKKPHQRFSRLPAVVYVNNGLIKANGQQFGPSLTRGNCFRMTILIVHTTELDEVGGVVVAKIELSEFKEN